MRTSKTNLVIEILVFLLVCFLVCVAFLPASPPGRSQVSVKFLRFTNGPANVPLAEFAITNLGASTVYCHRPAVADMVYEGTNCPDWHVMLGNGESTTFTMPASTNLSLWMLKLEVDPDAGPIRALQHFLHRQSARPSPYPIYSDWVTNPPPP
ncbi:MAG TPA: hypothetical protein VK815_09955 [Candidatus Acidoferrales bacterium]|jgi:hypothetical protein|nr:hypothetical protein [Candidatus Acidoferrales bacterium]